MSENMHQQKIEDLEARLSFQEDLLTAMNKRVAEQDAEIAKLQLQLQHLYQKFKESGAAEIEGGDALSSERPPHY